MIDLGPKARRYIIEALDLLIEKKDIELSKKPGEDQTADIINDVMFLRSVKKRLQEER